MVKYPERELIVVPECNDENDNPACWAMSCGKDDNGREHFIWICKYEEFPLNEFVVEDSEGFNLAHERFKTLWGAKRRAEGIAWKQEETGFYSD